MLNALRDMHGGEIFVPKIPSMRIIDLARVVAPECRTEIVGIRPGEKLHEVMVPVDDGRQTLQFEHHLIIKPSFPWWDGTWHVDQGGTPCPEGFYYGSDNNTERVSESDLARMIADLDLPEAREWARERGFA